jgi:hypothetical protein
VIPPTNAIELHARIVETVNSVRSAMVRGGSDPGAAIMSNHIRLIAVRAASEVSRVCRYT